MKAAVVTQQSPSGIGTQNFTDATFSSDCKLAIFASTVCTALDTNTNNAQMSLGATDKTRAVALAYAADDLPAANTDGAMGHSSSRCVYQLLPNGNEYIGAGISGVSHPSTGMQVNWTTVNSTRYVSALLLGGSDIEVSVVAIDLSVASYTNVTAAHGLSGTPNCLIVLGYGSTADATTGDPRLSVGFYDGTNSACYSHSYDDNVATTAVGGMVRNDYVAARHWTNSVVYYSSIGTLNATNVGLTASAAPNGTDRYEIICIKGGAGFSAKAGVFTTSTSGTPTVQVVSGMSVAPSVVLFGQDTISAVNAVQATSNAAHTGIGWAVNNGGSTQQFAVAAVTEDGVASTASYADTRAINDGCLLLMDGGNPATVLVRASVGASDWETDGVSLTYSQTNGTARHIPYLAFGTSTGPTISSAPSELAIAFNVTVTGTGFGASQGAGAVYIAPTNSIADANKVTQTIVSWSNTSITFTATRSTLAYNTNMYLFVQENGGTSNASGSVLQFKPGVTLSWSV